MKHINCKSYLGKEKINIDTKRINFIIGHYQKSGCVSLIRIFSFNIFQKVGKIYNVFGIQFNLYKDTI